MGARRGGTQNLNDADLYHFGDLQRSPFIPQISTAETSKSVALDSLAFFALDLRRRSSNRVRVPRIPIISAGGSGWGARGSQLPDLTKRTILMLKETNPSWGCEKISDMLAARAALDSRAHPCDSVSVVHLLDSGKSLLTGKSWDAPGGIRQ